MICRCECSISKAYGFMAWGHLKILQYIVTFTVMDQILLKEVKRLTIIALASDDCLMENLVLKGGNALDYYKSKQGKVSRTSYDIDMSLDEDIDHIELNDRIEKTLTSTFNENGYKVLDYKFSIKPPEPYKETFEFWGGYGIEFKLITLKKAAEIGDDADVLRRNALAVGKQNSTKLIVELSRFEYVGKKQQADMDGFTFYIYTPEMIVFEKVRALCQQVPKYGEIVPGFNRRARARDFYDIYDLCSTFAIDPSTEENLELIQEIFKAKKVPISFLNDVCNPEDLELHSNDWSGVVDTLGLADRENLESFAFYVEFFKKTFSKLTFP